VRRSPVMLYDASQTMADELLKKGVYVIGFFFPWYQRIKHELECNCLQHTKEHLDKSNRGIC
jgi:glycine C-acetyltransferase